MNLWKMATEVSMIPTCAVMTTKWSVRVLKVTYFGT